MGASSSTNNALGAAGGVFAAGILIFFAFALVGVALFIWWLLRLIEAVRIPESAWSYADQSKTVAVLLMVFLGILGTVVYSLAMRPRLKAAGVLGRR